MYPPKLRNFTVSTILTGYLPIDLDRYHQIEWDSRSTDISYRSRKLPNWVGQLGFIKWDISNRLNEIKKQENLRINASCKEDDRMYGQEWIDFLCDSKVAVGTESGSSTLDMDGRYLEEWQTESSIGSYREVAPISANYAAISPRIFEYAAAKCLIALTPGEYSGLLTPGIHYFELQPDLSNFQDLRNLMNNHEERSLMIERCYEDLISSSRFGYEQMVREIDVRIGSYLKVSKNFDVLDEPNKTIESRSNRTKRNSKSRSEFSTLKLLLRLTLSMYEKIFNWSLSRRGVIKNLLRSTYRMMRFIWTTEVMTLIKLVFSSEPHVIIDFKRIYRLTWSVYKSVGLTLEIQLIRSEAEIVASLGSSLKIQQTSSGLWISWPKAIQQSSELNEHPRLDSVYFPDSQGVWFTRGDYSEVHKPRKLELLSSYYKENNLKAREMLQIYCIPPSKN